MAISFTPEQQRVIDLQNCNILVSAAAGSGKTAVLSERIVKKVCDEAKPVDIDRLLIVTFTNAAAAEMRERIADGISGRLAQTPESEHIQKQATLIHNAQITTIDSFCLYLLRNHFNEIGLDPAFRIADEGEVRLMQQEALAELMEDGYRSGGEAFRYCVEYFCPGGREKALEQHILNLSRYAASFPFSKEWLEERKADYSAATVEEICGSDYGRYLLEYLHSAVRGCVEKLERVKDLCEAPDGPYMYGELVEGELEQLQGLLSCHTLSDYEVRLPAVSFGRLPSKKDDSVSAAKRELAKNLRAQVKDSVQGYAEKFFATPLELAARQAFVCREPAVTLIDLALDFDRRMQEKKRERKVIDFSDMEHYALDILVEREEGEIRPSRVALEYRQHFEEILTDEYQDSNLVQEYLLKAVSGEEDGHFNRFMVGDVKQSIYKFRLARPELFLEKYNTYQPGAGDCQRIDLSKNFRSRRQVVDAVNDIFSRLMSENTGGIAYDERAALYPGAVYPENGDCGSELILIEKPEKDSGLEEKQAEALAIAARIRELRAGFQVTDKESGLLRQAKYSDMVILLRSNSGWDEEFKEVLEGEGIPVYITSRTGYFDASEVQELLQFLRVLDNPTQDIPLFGVMKSLFGGFDEEEIAVIRSGRKDCALYEAVRYCAGDGLGAERSEAAGDEAQGEDAGAIKTGDEAQGESARVEKTDDEVRVENEGAEESEHHHTLRRKCAAFIEMIDRYRAMAVYLPIRELLAKLVDDFDYLNYVTALPAGGRRRANVEMLFTKASDFEKTSYFGLFHFIRYIEQLEKYDVDYGEADTLDENADVVRIMSIHKSKGLEFPITFVSGLSKRFNMQDANQALILDMDLGLGIDYVDPVRRVRNKTLRRMVLASKLKKDSLSEELRVLYVALTRAKEKLIMTATLQEAAEKWALCQETGSVALSFLDFVEGGSFLDFLLPALPGTSVDVKIVETEELAAAEFKEQFSLADRRNNLRYADRLGDEKAGKKLQERLEAVYPFAGLSGLYTKTTVSELKIAAMAGKDEAAYHTFEEKEVLPYIPAFRREEESVSGTVRGNAYHRVMELLDFERTLGAAWGHADGQMNAAGMEAANAGAFPGSFQEFTKGMQKGNPQIEKLAAALHSFLQAEAACGRLSEEYLQAVREQKILRFLCSELGWRMWKAHREGNLYREQPFVLGIDAKRLGGDFPDRETVLIQGIIDVFFVEEDGLVLLDYKTDSVRSMKELWNRYETQLEYYEEALVKLMGLPVKEKILYSFHLEEY